MSTHCNSFMLPEPNMTTWPRKAGCGRWAGPLTLTTSCLPSWLPPPCLCICEHISGTWWSRRHQTIRFRNEALCTQSWCRSKWCVCVPGCSLGDTKACAAWNKGLSIPSVPSLPWQQTQPLWAMWHQHPFVVNQVGPWDRTLLQQPG